MSLEALAEMTDDNMKLVRHASALSKAGVPGAGVNGPYTHPVAASNQLDVALREAGVALAPDQEATLRRLASHYASEDDPRRQDYADRDVPALQKLTEELALKARFFDEARGLLSADQPAVAFADATADRLGMNLFSPGMVLVQYATPVEVSSSEEYASVVGRSMARSLRLDQGREAELQAMVSSWVGRLPAAVMQPSGLPQGPLGQLLLSTGSTQTVLARQAALVAELDLRLALSPTQREAFRNAMKIYVPVVRAR